MSQPKYNVGQEVYVINEGLMGEVLTITLSSTEPNYEVDVRRHWKSYIHVPESGVAVSLNEAADVLEASAEARYAADLAKAESVRQRAYKKAAGLRVATAALAHDLAEVQS